MPLYPYETQLVVNANATSVILTDAQVTIYDSSDTGMLNPLSLVDHAGVPLSNPIQVTKQGFLPAFQATVSQVMWVGGGYFGFLSSYQGLLNEMIAARSLAANAAANALSAKQAAEAAAISAAAPSDASVDAGIVRANAVAAWKPSRAYTVGQYVVNPNGSLARALVTHTSGAEYDATKWQATSSGGASGTNFVVQDPTTGVIPNRPSSDPSILVFWITWTEPNRVTSGTGGAYPNDIWFQRTAP